MGVLGPCMDAYEYSHATLHGEHRGLGATAGSQTEGCGSEGWPGGFGPVWCRGGVGRVTWVWVSVEMCQEVAGHGIQATPTLLVVYLEVM